MKTLVIHPKDTTTTFLTPIYSNIENVTVLTGGYSKLEVNELIKKHDRIMMMGHGSPLGLFSIGQFANTHSYIIDMDTVPLLQNKECIFIWCNADKFVERFDLKGFYSGMFISEVHEASFCGLPNTPQDIVTESNDFFAKELGSVSDQSLDEMYQHIKYTYGLLTESNSVAEYNHNRLYLKN